MGQREGDVAVEVVPALEVTVARSFLKLEFNRVDPDSEPGPTRSACPSCAVEFTRPGCWERHPSIRPNELEQGAIAGTTITPGSCRSVRRRHRALNNNEQVFGTVGSMYDESWELESQRTAATLLR